MHRLKSLSIIATFAFAGCATQAQSPPPNMASTQNMGDLLTAQGYTAVPLRRVSNGLDTVSLRLNSVKGLFLLDTGASNSVIDTLSLSQFNVSANNLRRSDMAIGAGGSIRLSSYTISGLTIKGRHFPLQEISAADISTVISAFSRDTGLKLDGIIGQDVMISFDGIIDTKSKTLFLR